MVQNLWDSQILCDILDASLRGDYFTAQSVSIDSRTLKPGALFVALSGERFDGHHYLAKAQQTGAVGALVHRIPSDAPADFPLIVTPDGTLEALVKLAQAARTRTQATIIGITGSVGKTSAKEMAKLCFDAYGTPWRSEATISDMLDNSDNYIGRGAQPARRQRAQAPSANNRTYASSGNYNNHIGLPLSLANMPLDTEYGIFEMGMNHAGEIDHLTRIARPHIALITTVEAVHLEFFDSIEGIAYAKAEIFNGLVEGGAAILPRDNAYYDVLKRNVESNVAKQQSLNTQHSTLTFGTHPESTLQLLSAEPSAQGTHVTYLYGKQERSFTLGTLGAHWPKAALGILGLIAACDLPLEPAEAALANYTEQPGRGQLSEVPFSSGTLSLIDDAYNASPVSMKAALQTLGSLKPEGTGRRVAILGEMLELGPNTQRFHEELKASLEDSHIEMVILVGNHMKFLESKLSRTSILVHYHPHIDSLPNDWMTLLQPQDILLVKGSHGSGVHQLVTQLKQPQADAHAL